MASNRVDPVDQVPLLAAIVQSTNDAIISVSLDGTITSWNRAAEVLYGYISREAIGQPNRLIIPPDRVEDEHTVLKRLADGQIVPPYQTIRIRKNGAPVTVLMTASAIRGADGRIIGASKISRDLAIGHESLVASRRLAAIVENSDDAIISKNLHSIITSWNPAAERMFGYTAAEAIGQSIRLIIPPDRQDEETTVLDRITRGEKIEHFETVRCRKDGACLPVSLTVSPLRDDEGTVVGASKIARDITERKRAEAQTERDQTRAAFLARMAKALSTSPNYQETLNAMAALAVPALADWCAVDIVQEDGNIVRMAIAHVDGAKRDLIGQSYADPGAAYSVTQVIRTGTPALIPDISDDMIDAAARSDPERGAVLRSLGARSYLCVPLQVGARTVGALTMVIGDSDRRYSDSDLQFAEEIASRVALTVENARSYEALERANRLKDEFLATLSHELRTPLNAILGYSRMVRGGLMTGEKLMRAVETIERNSSALTKMVDDLLDVSRIVSGKLRLNVQPVDLPQVLQEAVQTVRPAADAKRIKIHTVIDPQVAPIAGDPDRLRQVVWNLLANAVKFTPKEGRVQLRLERINSSVDIIVSDSGMGIAPEFLPQIFERFRQAEAGTTRQHAGLGLGLAIARNIVEMHGGRITASSDGPGTGATFRVRLPVMIVHAGARDDARVHPHHETPRAVEPLPDLSGTHVLAVDDEPDALRLLKEILEAAGAQVTTAPSAAVALEKITAARPHVLVADLGMPLMDGFELIRLVRNAETPAVRNIPAAALTAYARSEDRAKSLQSGFEMHLAKPVDPIELASAVKALARHRAGS